MNLSIYLSQDLENRLSLMSQQLHTSKNSIIREALEEWITRHTPHSSWPPHFFDFEPINDAPDFSSYRKDLSPPKEDIFYS
jgi:hypothetical protein